MRRRRSYTLLLIGVLPLFLALQNPKFGESLRLASITFLKPFLVACDSAAGAFRNTRAGFVRFWGSFQSQQKLEARIAELESERLRWDETLKENERLKKMLDFRQTLSEKGIGARVIGWDLSPWRKTVILDKGAQHGLKKNMAVVVLEGLVGRLVEVGPISSRAILLLDPDARVSALADKSRAQGVVMGDGTPTLKMGYLELEGGAGVEETVLASGVGGLFPKGLRIGKITGLGKDATGLHLVAQVQPFVSFSKLEEVLCLESFPSA